MLFRKKALLLAPGTPCPFCNRGVLELGTQEKSYDVAGHHITQVPYFRCGTCNYEGHDLTLLVEIQKKVQTWLQGSASLPLEIPFIHFGIAVPLPEQKAS
ncbi:hypothetical protein [Reticulibacter mediterranei]|nr:hypothetical protein [Reticulibacter mediterranei]